MVQQFFCFRLETTAKFFGWLGSFVTIIFIIICAELLRNARALIGTLTRKGYNFDDPERAGTSEYFELLNGVYRSKHEKHI